MAQVVACLSTCREGHRVADLQGTGRL